MTVTSFILSFILIGTVANLLRALQHAHKGSDPDTTLCLVHLVLAWLLLSAFFQLLKSFMGA